MKKMTIPAIFLLLLVGFNTFAQENKCVRGGWVADKDPKGTNVRDSPSLKGKIIGNIPHAKDDGEQAMVEVIGYSNGWLKIQLAESVDGTTFFTEIGWISAKKVAASVETKTGKSALIYFQPNKTSKKVGTIPNETSITIVGFDCFGFRVSYKGKTGWLAADDTCGNPVTTCP